ncbi:helix-turn-helix transcriptional regulator [Rhodococcus sp. HNM0569]|uniref:MerR family transcriptional regulator n=1 Tax=Rhodococcus sp. HNM0569 TaxID=2716340 RepID=UPI00146ABF59|nr:helix-turn-helix transcriptional regulator [Rhodococcus sp. HNM0569]
MNSPASSTPSSRGVYGISVTAELSGIGPQTLRLYERRGLLTPTRTGGGTRRYSQDDLERLARISQLIELGVNLTGIREILTLEEQRATLEQQNADLLSRATDAEAQLDKLRGAPA